MERKNLVLSKKAEPLRTRRLGFFLDTSCLLWTTSRSWAAVCIRTTAGSR